MCDIRVSISYFDQILGKREFQTWQIFNFANFVVLKLYAGTKFRENGQKSRSLMSLSYINFSFENFYLSDFYLNGFGLSW